MSIAVGRRTVRPSPLLRSVGIESVHYLAWERVSNVKMKGSSIATAFRASRALQLQASRLSLARNYGTVSDAPNDPAALGLSSSKSVFQQAVEAKGPRTNWTKEEIKQIHDMPLMELAFAAVSNPYI